MQHKGGMLCISRFSAVWGSRVRKRRRTTRGRDWGGSGDERCWRRQGRRTSAQGVHKEQAVALDPPAQARLSWVQARTWRCHDSMLLAGEGPWGIRKHQDDRDTAATARLAAPTHPRRKGSGGVRYQASSLSLLNTSIHSGRRVHSFCDAEPWQEERQLSHVTVGEHGSIETDHLMTRPRPCYHQNPLHPRDLRELRGGGGGEWPCPARHPRPLPSRCCPERVRHLQAAWPTHCSQYQDHRWPLYPLIGWHFA